MEDVYPVICCSFNPVCCVLCAVWPVWDWAIGWGRRIFLQGSVTNPCWNSVICFIIINCRKWSALETCGSNGMCYLCITADYQENPLRCFQRGQWQTDAAVLNSQWNSIQEMKCYTVKHNNMLVRGDPDTRTACANSRGVYNTDNGSYSEKNRNVDSTLMLYENVLIKVVVFIWKEETVY